MKRAQRDCVAAAVGIGNYRAALGGTRSTADSLINQSRWYDPSVGRWLSEDPSGLSAGPNPYEYCGNGPTDGTDPSGLFKRGSWSSRAFGSFTASVTVEETDLKSGDLLAHLAELVTGNPKDKDAFSPLVRGTKFRAGDVINVAPLLVRLEETIGKNIVAAAKSINAQFPTDKKAYCEFGYGPDANGLSRAGVLAFWKPEPDWKKRPLCDCAGAMILAATKGLIDTVGAALYDQLKYTNSKKQSYSYNTKYRDLCGVRVDSASVGKLPIGVWGHFNNLKAYGKGGTYIGENVISEGNGKFWGFSGNGAENAMYSEKTAGEWKSFLIDQCNTRNGTNIKVQDVKDSEFVNGGFLGNFYFYDAAAIGMQVFDLRQAKAAGGGQPK